MHPVGFENSTTTRCFFKEKFPGSAFLYTTQIRYPKEIMKKSDILVHFNVGYKNNKSSQILISLTGLIASEVQSCNF